MTTKVCMTCRERNAWVGADVNNENQTWHIFIEHVQHGQVSCETIFEITQKNSQKILKKYNKLSI